MEYLNAFAVLAVTGASIGFGAVAVGLTALILRGQERSVSQLDKAVIGWLLYDACTHLTLVRRLSCAARAACS